ncbi:MAG: prepilin-type N-terminal cleavage/methylation domain-containing protein [Anaerohalosphaeraceae bacterium]|nr:prepilin-type N-terminal cleavage/methylation domain-containing protein [Anaerohalosphaeraceae bacterium]
MTKSRKKCRNGFTILEVLVVILLAGLLAGAAGGMYASTYKKMLVKKSAMDFLLAAKYARITAIERQSRCSIKIDSDNRKFVLVVEHIDEFGQDNQEEVRNLYSKPTEFDENVNFEYVKIVPAVDEANADMGSANTINFFADGSAESAVVQIGNSEDHFTVRISAISARAMLFEDTAENIQSDSVDLDEVRI